MPILSQRASHGSNPSYTLHQFVRCCHLAGLMLQSVRELCAFQSAFQPDDTLDAVHLDFNRPRRDDEDFSWSPGASDIAQGPFAPYIAVDTPAVCRRAMGASRRDDKLLHHIRSHANTCRDKTWCTWESYSYTNRVLGPDAASQWVVLVCVT